MSRKKWVNGAGTGDANGRRMKHSFGLALGESERADLIAFLETL